MFKYVDGLSIGAIIGAAMIFFGIIAVIIVVCSIHAKYESFASDHSEALKTLERINYEYRPMFKKVEHFQMTHSYDNIDFYSETSCKDYLTYQLVYEQKDIRQALKDTLYNKNLYGLYIKDIEKKCSLGKFDNDVLTKNKELLLSKEKKLFEKNQIIAQTTFSIPVRLNRTNINGVYQTSKHEVFFAEEIKDILNKLSQKNGNFYLNREVWDSICRVERGKVSHKMRFAIFERDHHRCRRCGSTYNLEIDHIIPIAKGGKSTYNNLQTLCHRCNKANGSDLY